MRGFFMYAIQNMYFCFSKNYLTMLQIQFIKDNTALIIEGLNKRNFDAAPILEEVLALDKKRRSTQVLFDNNQAESNKLSKEIGMLFKDGEIQKANLLKEKTVQLKEASKELIEELNLTQKSLTELMYIIPNVPHSLAYRQNLKSIA